MKISKGIQYILIAAFFFVAMQSCIKLLKTYHFSQIIFFRSVIPAAVCIFLLKKQKVSLIGNDPKWLIARALFGVTAMSLFFITIQRMPLGASITLKYLSPIFVGIFAYFLLKERLRPLQILFFALAAIGVFILKGFDTRIDMLNLIFGIVGAVCAGIVYVIIRKIGQTEHSLVIINYFMLTATVISSVVMYFYWTMPTLDEWLLLLFIGSIGYFAQLFMTKAFQVEQASVIAPFRYVEVVYSMIIGLIWFGESYTWMSILGILLIIGSMLGNVLIRRG